MMISRDIERTYSFSISDVADETENIQNKAAEIEENDDSDESDDKEDENIISGFISKAKDAVEDVVINPLEEKVAQAKKMVNAVVNAIIVLVITSCVIPLFTLIAVSYTHLVFQVYIFHCYQSNFLWTHTRITLK